MKSVPEVDLERIQQIYAELKNMDIQLDPNPIEYGPKRFNKKIAKARALLSRLDQIFLQVSEDLHYFKRVINQKRNLYELDKRELLVHDPKCRMGRSQQEREALADTQLRAKIEEFLDLEESARDLETVMLVIKAKRTDLKDAQSRMRDQMKLIEHDISMGAQWGRQAYSNQGFDDLSKGMEESLQDIDELLKGEDEPPEIVLSENGEPEVKNALDDLLSSFDDASVRDEGLEEIISSLGT